MGPIALFDKSFLQSLSVDESVWFDHFFLANVCPIFYAETQADLAKEDGKSLTPEELVGRIAAKFPDFSGSPNVHHRTMCTASLLGHEVPLRPQIILPRGCHATVSGHPVAILPESPEARAFLRWTQGQFEEEERQAAAEWRQSSHGYETPEVIDALRKLKAFDNAPCSTLGGVRDATDEALRRLTEEQKVWLVSQLMGVYRHYRPEILKRWEYGGRSTLETFAPYASFVLRVELFYHIAAHKGRMSAAQRLDMTYMFYLPFCHVFVSKDRVHRNCAPFFLRDEQDFIWGPDLKEALRSLNALYSALPDAEKSRSIHAIASHPPLDGENLVTKLWDRYGPTWRTPRTVKCQDVKDLTAWWQERIKDIEKTAESGGDPTPPPDRPLDAIVIKRRAPKKKGAWWRVPEAVRNPERPDEAASDADDAQGIQFYNGATAENVVGQEISVYLKEGKPDISSLPQCRTFLNAGSLWVDCVPPLNRKYAAPVPNDAMISRSSDGEQLAVFVLPTSALGTLVVKLFKMREEYDKRQGA